ncbi:MAG: lysostaphin resistance A-like protein [Pikeienuella sp.]|uniref:CPBP family intramembrane glutamic endopeptidase n=1 Tax=Pikeienuella sp. TaxID=2831957 RepID=UPI0039199BB9
MEPALFAFAEPARPRAAPWRVLAGLITIGLFLILSGIALGWVAFRAGLARPEGGLEMLERPEGAIFALATFLLWWPALWLSLRLFHRRGIGSALGPGKGAARLFAAGLGWAALFVVITTVAGIALAGPPDLAARGLGDWALLAAVALPLIFVQTGAEEAVFRGYILQQMAARYRSPLAWAVLPSLLFGALHWHPAAPGGGFAMMAATGLAGLVFALAAARTGSIYAAWGAHFGVNCGAILLVGAPGWLSGLAAFHWDGAALGALMAVDLAGIGAALLIILGVSRWRRAGRGRR